MYKSKMEASFCCRIWMSVLFLFRKIKFYLFSQLQIPYQISFLEIRLFYFILCSPYGPNCLMFVCQYCTYAYSKKNCYIFVIYWRCLCTNFAYYILCWVNPKKKTNYLNLLLFFLNQPYCLCPVQSPDSNAWRKSLKFYYQPINYFSSCEYISIVTPITEASNTICPKYTLSSPFRN